MLDWTTGAPNARFEVLRLLHDHLRADATLVETKLIAKNMDALAFEMWRPPLTARQQRNRTLKAELPEEFDAALPGQSIQALHCEAGTASWSTANSGSIFGHNCRREAPTLKSAQPALSRRNRTAGKAVP